MAKLEPGRDPQMVERTNKLSVLFAITSMGLLLAFSVMVWVDYDREWKRYQDEFTRLDVQFTEKQIEDALGRVDANRRRELEAKLAQGEQEADARRAEIRQAEREIEKLQGEWYGVDQNYRFTKARIDVAKYEYEEALQKKAGEAEARGRHLADLEKEWEDWRLKLEDVNERLAAAQKKRADLEKTKLEAENVQKELFAEHTRLEERLRKIKPGITAFLRNLPVLDMFNPSKKINQVMPASLEDDVIFVGTPKVDRCTTCHLGIDRKGFEDAPQPFRTHSNLELYLQGPHPIDRIGCTVCHLGRGRATGFVNAAHTASTREQEQAWGKYSGTKEYERLHYWDLPMTARGHTESQCAKCHQGVVEVPKAARLNTGIRLIERYGCQGCHKIKGWEGLRKVGPDLTKVTSKTDAEWIYRWIKEPKGFRPTRMPQVWDVRVNETAETKRRNDVEANAVTAYIVARATQEQFPAPPPGDLEAGRRTFETVGCLACHRVGDDRRGITGPLHASFRAHGPNLDGTGSKLDAGWVYAWVKDPKRYWAETRMPNLRLTDEEAADVTAYLMSLKNDDFRARPRPALDAPLRDRIVREYLLAQNPVKEADAKLAAMSDEQRTMFLGEKTIARYGCFGCHTIAGFEKATPIGAELTEQGSKLVERLDFAFQHGKIPHTLPAWTHLKLKEPRIYDEGKEQTKKPEELLRMPKFWVSDEETGAIVTAVLSFSKERVPLAAQKRLSADDRYVQEGARLVRDFNCRGCHKIGEEGGTIEAVVEAQLEAAGKDTLQAGALSPPLLYNARSRIGEGARVQTPWLHAFLEDPSKEIRPWLDLRMPSFEFSQEQLNTITRYFAAQDGVPYPYEQKPALDPQMVAIGRDLFGRWQCVKCHVVAGKLPDQEPANMAPDLAKVPERLRADWLAKWLADPQKIQPGTRMPANFPKNPQENAYPDVLGGDQQKQIEAVRAYLLTLGGASAQRSASRESAGSRGSPGGGGR